MITMTLPDGDPIEAPSEAQLADALDALLGGSDEAADLWLEDEEGWALSVVTSGDLFFENLEDDSRYWTIGPLEREGILRLMALFARGEIDALRAEPWEEEE